MYLSFDIDQERFLSSYKVGVVKLNVVPLRLDGTRLHVDHFAEAVWNWMVSNE